MLLEDRLVKFLQRVFDKKKNKVKKIMLPEVCKVRIIKLCKDYSNTYIN